MREIPNCKVAIAILAYLCCTTFALAASAAPTRSILQWNTAALQGIRDAKLGAPVAARALAIVHTCMYDAWAAYDERAAGTQLHGVLRRPANERTQGNKERAISYAAYRALTDVLPVDTNSVYTPLMKELGYDPNDHSTDIETPTGIGNVACAAVLEFRHHDKSNQLGDMIPVEGTSIRAATGPYGDWSGYRPVNSPGMVPARFPFSKPLNPDHWQPLTYTDSTGSLVLQMSRRYGGIHFARADMTGRKLGVLVADRAWLKAQTYFDGTHAPTALELTAAN